MPYPPYALLWDLATEAIVGDGHGHVGIVSKEVYEKGKPDRTWHFRNESVTYITESSIQSWPYHRDKARLCKLHQVGNYWVHFYFTNWEGWVVTGEAERVEVAV